MEDSRNIDIDNIATDLNGKLDVDMTNMGTLSASAISKLKEILDGDSSGSPTGSLVNSVTIIDTYGDSNSYYIVLSNGYCVQGGFHDFLVSTSPPVTIQLLKTYANAKYELNAANTASYSGSYAAIMGGSATPFSFTNARTILTADEVTASSFRITDPVVLGGDANSYQTVSSKTVDYVVWATSGFLAAGQY